MKLGYDKPLFILAFDHRSSFLKKMFGVSGEPSAKIIEELKKIKKIIFEGFKKGIEMGIPKDQGAILVDEQFGTDILKDAISNGNTFCKSVEISGQDEFDFEYGEEWRDHLARFKPTIAKALIRYNPEGDAELNARQRARLKILSDYSHENGFKFLIEPLIPATEEQLKAVDGSQERYDAETRPGLMVKMIAELQKDGVEPDIWKIEGLEDPKHYQEVLDQARTGGRDGVVAVVLGRGAEDSQVEKWLRAGKGIPGMVGFAIGRTIFWDALKDFKDGKQTEEQATQKIGENYHHFYKVFAE